VLGIAAGGGGGVGDSGINLLANRLADDSVSSERTVGNMSESLSNMMEKKLAGRHSQKVRLDDVSLRNVHILLLHVRRNGVCNMSEI